MMTMPALFADLPFALRMLRKSPGFTAIAILSLGLGIGANTTIFSFLNALFLRPLPVADPDRVVAVFTSDHSGPLYSASSYPDYLDFRESGAFSGLAAWTVAPLSFGEGTATDRVFGELVTANYFSVAGVEAARGRAFREELDGARSAAPAVVVSDAFWRRRFGADPALVGKPVTVNGRPFTIVGIAPAGFTGMMRGLVVDLWVPMTAPGAIPSSDRLDRRGSRWLFLLGRLQPGLNAAAARARLAVLGGQLQQAYPDNWTDVRGNRRIVSVVPEREARVFPGMSGTVLGFLGLLLGVVGLVLLLACTNVAGLQLARATARRHETAVRMSLGAGRGRLIRQLLTESVLLALLAGGAGILMALWAIDFLMTVRPPLPFPVALELGLDLRVLGYTLVLSVLTGVVFGLVPALQASRTDVVSSLKAESLAGAGLIGRWSARRLLVVAQTAVSLVLLVGAGLAVRSLRNAHRIDPGFDASGLVLLSLDLRLAGYEDPRGQVFYEQLLDRVQGLPGVGAASLATDVPLGLGGTRRHISIEGYEPRSGEDMEVHTNTVGPGYFRTMGVRLVGGREFAPTDTERTSGVAIVNEAFARRYWPGQDPLGKRLTQGSRDNRALEVVGVVRDGKYVSLGEDPTPCYYISFLQHYRPGATLHVRASGDPGALVAALRREVRALDPSLPIFDVKTMTDHLGLSLLPARVAGSLLGLFGLVALALAAMGIYGVMAHAVGQRTRELGVRLALGARPGDLMNMILRQGMQLAALGLGLGLVAALALTRLASGLLYGISATDPATFLVVPSLLAASALLASYLPGRAAMTTDPMVALRHE